MGNLPNIDSNIQCCHFTSSGRVKRSARSAANPISDSRNQIIRISPQIVFNFHF